MTVKVNMDLGEAEAAMGFISGMASTMQTGRYVSSVTGYAHNAMARAFDRQVDLIARGNPESFNHVYEARQLGMPNGRLWQHRMQGGNSYTRIASFVFLPSTQPILTPEERMKNSYDPMSKVSAEAIGKLSGRNYTFTNKATMMEYGLPAVVRPTGEKKLFVPTLRNKGYFTFKKYTVQNWSRANPQDASGGAGTQGKFTQFWTEWWSVEAPRLWDKNIKTIIENDIGRNQHEMLKVTHSRRKPKSFKMSVFSAKADYDAGKVLAEATMNKQAMSYEQASKYIDRAWLT